ncbi:hypothetical protein KPSA3_06607 [Pseudomonas syringae pv. actinidiae]|uniref:Uncharacterized protein n=1 Tax=Pseudomonas syringae pv. actinidiae TaxID=103796 RepID=A0AAN4QCQ4_PSESF|nr:hypothetical protein KPSA3_06607 [Pseudomonas syringae pv. actinidiae]
MYSQPFGLYISFCTIDQLRTGPSAYPWHRNLSVILSVDCGRWINSAIAFGSLSH